MIYTFWLVIALLNPNGKVTEHWEPQIDATSCETAKRDTITALQSRPQNYAIKRIDCIPMK